MASQRRINFLTFLASCPKFLNRIKKVKWPCRCGCIWTVSCSWVWVDNMDRTNQNDHHCEEDISGIELKPHGQSERELPHLPDTVEMECNLHSVNNHICDNEEDTQQKMDFWASIEKVKQVRQVYLKYLFTHFASHLNSKW